MTAGDSIVVISPHSDDGVLSVGASMSAWAREGRSVELLTVLALDPESGVPTSGWDRRAGFATEGEAARARRLEDGAACSMLGVTARWLPFGSVDFERHATDDEVWQAARAAVEGASVVLLPGWPLSHPDHAWLSELLVRHLPADRIARYAEQPYASREEGVPYPASPVAARDRVAKWRAVRAYRSQLPLLGMRNGLRRGPLRLALEPERIAWPDLYSQRS